MKNKTNFGLILVLVLATAVVSSFISAAITGNLIYPVASKSTISANSCNADSLCETNSIQTASIKTKVGANQVLVLSSDNGIVRVNGQLETNTITTPGALSISPSKNLVLSSGGTISLGGEYVKINTFVPFRATMGSGYVCVDNAGVLFRSEDAC